MKDFLLPLLGIALGTYATIDSCSHAPPQKKEVVVVVDTVVVKDSLSSENLLSFIVELDMESPIIVLKQAVLETGHFTSYGCHERNNLFGLQGQHGYLKFNTWQDCCIYYKNMQCRRYNGENYYQWLHDIGWAKDPNYLKTLKNIRL